jgi:hypothetical protein
VDIEAVSMKVEMQTISTKVTLAEFGGPDFTLLGGRTLENVVSHEIKELGQHVLACTVQYRLPPNARPPPSSGQDSDDPTLQSFRKFYKFAVRRYFHTIAKELTCLTIGYQSSVRENKSTCPAITFCSTISDRERQDLPGSPHSKPDARFHVVRTHAVSMCGRLAG